MVPPSGTHGTEECVLYPRRGYLIVTPDGRGVVLRSKPQPVKVPARGRRPAPAGADGDPCQALRAEDQNGVRIRRVRVSLGVSPFHVGSSEV